MDKNPKTAKTNWVPAIGKPYSFRKEFCPSLGITDYQVTKRKQDLLTWLTNFYDYEFIEANVSYCSQGSNRGLSTNAS